MLTPVKYELRPTLNTSSLIVKGSVFLVTSHLKLPTYFRSGMFNTELRVDKLIAREIYNANANT